MQGDFSRRTYDRTRAYTRVLQQQGRAILDADWNEQADLLEDLSRAALGDVVGAAGAPEDGGGFAVLADPSTPDDVALAPGRLWAAGLLVESGAAIAVEDFPSASTATLDRATLDGRAPQAGDWLELRAVRHDGLAVWQGGAPLTWLALVQGFTASNRRAAFAASVPQAVRERVDGERVEVRRVLRYRDQPFDADPPAVPVPQSARTDLVYLDVWQRHRTAVEDESLRDRALGGADTATRVQTTWQVRIQPGAGPDCDAAASAPWPDVEPSRGRLSARSRAAGSTATPCDPGEAGGYTGVENRLYRVEIHDGGGVGVATFKWSRDNGSVLLRAVQVKVPAGGKSVVVLKGLGRDDVLSLHRLDWVELLDRDARDLGTPGRMAKVAAVDPALLEVQLELVDGTLLAADASPDLLLRRWDQPSSGDPVLDTDEGFVLLEEGVEVAFHGSAFRPGDWWVFAARAVSPPEVETLDRVPPMGVRHHHVPLAYVSWTPPAAPGGAWTKALHDCRPVFRPLSADHLVLLQEGGDGQESGPGLELPAPLRVAVVDQWGEPVKGQAVRVAVPAGTGKVGPLLNADGTPAPDPTQSTATASTDDAGVVSFRWILGAALGPQWLTASLASIPRPQRSSATATFQATARLRLRVLGGDGQAGRRGQTLGAPLGVVVEDPHGRPVNEVTVRFSLLRGPGHSGTGTAATADVEGALHTTANPPGTLPAPAAVPVTTGNGGVAAIRWTLGAAASVGGSYAVEAALDPGYPAGAVAMRCRFWARVREQLSIRMVGGDGQSGRPGQELGCPVAVVVEDEQGRTVEGAIVTVARTGGDTVAVDEGSAHSTDKYTTNVDGRASFDWTLGPGAGCHTLGIAVDNPPQGSKAPVIRFRAQAANPPPPDPRPLRLTKLGWAHAGIHWAGLLVEHGLLVEFSKAPVQACANVGNYSLTIEPLSGASQSSGSPRWFTPVVLPAEVQVGAEGTRWLLRLVGDPAQLNAMFNTLCDGQPAGYGRPAGHLLCRVSLRGSGIHDAQKRALAGPALPHLNTAPATTVGGASPDGPLVEGLDVHSWFFLVKGKPFRDIVWNYPVAEFEKKPIVLKDGKEGGTITMRNPPGGTTHTTDPHR